MKNQSIIFVLLTFCVVFFSGCKKEEETEPSVKEQIIGKWNYQSYKTQRYNADGQIEYEDSGITIDNSFLEYKEDGTFSIVRPSTSNSEEVKRDGTWELIENDSKLRLLYTNGNEAINIINELTEEKLVLLYEVEFAEGGILKNENTLVR